MILFILSYAESAKIVGFGIFECSQIFFNANKCLSNPWPVRKYVKNKFPMLNLLLNLKMFHNYP